MSGNNSSEVWQVDAGRQIYETSFDEMAQWIAEGSLLPQDKVRRGNLRWMDAQKVPALGRFFNAKERGLPQPVFSADVQTADLPHYSNAQKCLIHADAASILSCEVCANPFCQNCVDEKVCPMCGADLSPSAVKSTVPTSPNNFGNSGFTDFSSFQPNLPQMNIKPVSFPSDITKIPNEHRIALPAVIIISLLLAGLTAYLSAYQFAKPNQILEDALPEVAALDSNFKSEKEKEEKFAAEVEASRKKEREKENEKTRLAKINETRLPASDCTNGMGQRIKCDERLSKLREQLKDDFPQYKPRELPDFMLENGTILNVTKIIEEKHKLDRNKIIEKYRQQRNKSTFITTFFITFAGFFGGLFFIRKLTKR